MSAANADGTSIDEIAAEIRRAMPESASRVVRRSGESIRAFSAAERYLVPGLDPGATFAFAKKPLLRVLRIITRGQGTYNTALLEGARELQQKLEDYRGEGEDLRQLVMRLDGRLAELMSVTDEIRDGLARQASQSRAETAEALARQDREFAVYRAETATEFGILREQFQRDLETLRGSLTDDVASLRQSAGVDSTRLHRDIDLVHARLSTQEREGRLAPGVAASDSAVAPSRPGLPDGFYIRFEEEFRGSEAEIRARQRLYAEFFQNAPGIVLDCGCGRGEFLEVLQAQGIAAQGVDINEISIQLATEKGLHVSVEDGFTNLQRWKSELGGVAALQVVEHLDPADVYELLELAHAALAPGGRLLLETINPDSVYALRAYRLDPTHRWPVPAATLDLMAREVGFEARRVELLSPVPDTERLAEADENDRKLNRLLFAPQDYALFAEKPR